MHNRLKKLRTLHHMTQLDVCRSIDCPKPLYSLIERGLMEPREQDLPALAKLFNVSESYIRNK